MNEVDSQRTGNGGANHIQRRAPGAAARIEMPCVCAAAPRACALAPRVTALKHGNAQLREELRDAQDRLSGYGRALVAMQRSILPHRLPQVPGLELAACSAGDETSGGAFFNVWRLGPDNWGVVVADVGGHGLAAAAVLGVVQALGQALKGCAEPPSPGAALALINRPLTTRELANTGLFVTMFAGCYDARTQVLKYACAGHSAPRLVRGEVVHYLDAVYGIPLGVDEESRYPEAVVQLRPGDRLALFTFGVIGSTNTGGVPFGEGRLDGLLQRRASGAEELLARIVGSVRAYQAGWPVRDAGTCLVLAVGPVDQRTQA